MPSRDWHVVTCEFPPEVGGVSDYSQVMASALATTEATVHVWCSGTATPESSSPGVIVHRIPNLFTPRGLRQMGRAMNGMAPRRLFVQWVPHGYGYRAMNVLFACWLASRTRWRGDELHLMVHEPFMPFSGAPLHRAVSVVQRVMLAVVGAAARRVWVSTPAWTPHVRPWIPQKTPVEWLPIPSPRTGEAAMAAVGRDAVAHPEPVVGHFGTYSPLLTPLLEVAMDIVLQRSRARLLFVGRNSGQFAQAFIAARPQHATRVSAAGVVAPEELAGCFASCDLMLQPYPDGVNARRTSTIGLLALGRPVVSNAGAATEPFWNANDALALVQGGDGTALGQATLALLEDAERRRALGLRARAFYLETFDVAHAIDRLTQAGPAANTKPAALALPQARA